jgi:hypothetical protein
MSIRRSLWLALMTGLLIAAFLGTTGGAVTAEPEPRATNQAMTIAPAAFRPADQDTAFTNNFGILYSNETGTSAFGAPLFFDAPEVKIRKIVLYASDNGPADICLQLRRLVAKDAQIDEMAEVCSTGESAGNRKFVVKDVSPKWIKEAHGAYFQIFMPQSNDYVLYGAQIFYTIP